MSLSETLYGLGEPAVRFVGDCAGGGDDGAPPPGARVGKAARKRKRAKDEALCVVGTCENKRDHVDDKGRLRLACTYHHVKKLNENPTTTIRVTEKLVLDPNERLAKMVALHALAADAVERARAYKEACDASDEPAAAEPARRAALEACAAEAEAAADEARAAVAALAAQRAAVARARRTFVWPDPAIMLAANEDVRLAALLQRAEAAAAAASEAAARARGEAAAA